MDEIFENLLKHLNDSLAITDFDGIEGPISLDQISDESNLVVIGDEGNNLTFFPNISRDSSSSSKFVMVRTEKSYSAKRDSESEPFTPYDFHLVQKFLDNKSGPIYKL